jgi:hypothetical protein
MGQSIQVMPLKSPQVAGRSPGEPEFLPGQQLPQRLDVSQFPVLPAKGDFRSVQALGEIAIQSVRSR